MKACIARFCAVTIGVLFVVGDSQGEVVLPSPDSKQPETTKTMTIASPVTPSVAYEMRKVHEVVNHSEHQDKVHVHGQITGKQADETYAFKDENGDIIHVNVKAHSLPQQGLQLNKSMVVKGEVVKSPDEPVRIEADVIHYIF